MIRVNKILDILELVVWSGRIKGEQPVSALVTAPPEAGKTELVLKFAQNDGCVALTDVTAYGIMRDYGPLIREGKVRHLVIPDLVKPLARGKDTVHNLIAFLNSLIEEGVVRISTYAEKVGAPTQGKEEPIPVKCGLIATLAEGVLGDGRRQWSRMGFMSRLLPISYDYGPAAQLEIHESIAKREYRSDTPIKLSLPTDDVEVKLDLPQAEELMKLTNLLALQGNGKNPQLVYGFRRQKHMQRLAMASALRDGRDSVEKKDVDVIKDLADHINLEYHHI